LNVLDYFSRLKWLSTNIENILFSFIFIIVVYGFYNFSLRQMDRLRREGKLDETVLALLKKTFRWGLLFIVVAFVVAQFGIRIDFVAGLLVLASGTVLGFAAMTTLGNTIAGIILMVSRPFKIGDRLFLDGQFMDVESIDLIYTRMKTPDNVLISIPNQTLIQTKVTDYGKDRVIRRSHPITAGYEDPPEKIEGAMLEAASRVEEVLTEPQPYVWITEFQNFAVEYTLYVFINDIKHIQEIDSKIRKHILEACSRHGIDIRTPSLLRSL